MSQNRGFAYEARGGLKQFPPTPQIELRVASPLLIGVRGTRANVQLLEAQAPCESLNLLHETPADRAQRSGPTKGPFAERY